jgi:uncharacterized protein YbaP (TraB family)
MLYKVFESDSPQNVSYIFGTLHAKSKGAYHYYKQASSCLNNVTTFAAEIDLSDPYTQKSSILFQLPKEKPLSSWMNPNQYNKVRKQFIKSFGVDIHDLRYFQPLYILSHISVNLLDNEFLFPLDYKLFLDATELNLKIDGLERMSDQFKLIELLDINKQVKQLRQVASNPKYFREKIKHHQKVYQSNDIQRLYHLGRNAIGYFRGPLLKNRNKKIADKFIELMNKESVFGAVGASHLGGHQGVLSIIKSAGFKVKQQV